VVALGGCALIAGTLANLALRPIVLAISVVGLAVAVGFATSLWLASRWAAHARDPASPSGLRRVAAAYAAYARHPAALACFLALSIIESLVPAFAAFVVARGLDLGEPLWVFISVFPVALMVARLPVSLGGFGVQEASFVYLSGLLGMGRSDAVATMLVVDAVLVLTLLPAAFDVSILRQQRPTS
jgi:hypothetical protein